LEQRFQPCPEATWLLVPGDHPALDASVVPQLETAYATQSRFSIAIPTYKGRRGHPTLFSWKHVAALRAYPAELRLNTYVRQHAAETLEVPVDSAGVLWDMDTPEDYELLQQNWPLSPTGLHETRTGRVMNSHEPISQR
jgi:molybdenum cofactor cytidylyltransferase